MRMACSSAWSDVSHSRSCLKGSSERFTKRCGPRPLARSGDRRTMRTDVRTEERASAPSTAREATLRPMREDDLLRFVWDADPQISPDGRRVAFTRVWIDRDADEYRTQVWIAESGTDARPWTSGQYDAQPRWSPDGRWLAFVRKSEAKKPAQIFVMPTEGGEATPLTKLEGGASEP